MPIAKKGSIVVVVEYHHKYGEDVWVVQTMAKARKSAAEVVMKWVDGDDLDSGSDAHNKARCQIHIAFKRKDYTKILRLWCVNTNEFFGFICQRVQ